MSIFGLAQRGWLRLQNGASAAGSALRVLVIALTHGTDRARTAASVATIEARSKTDAVDWAFRSSVDSRDMAETITERMSHALEQCLNHLANRTRFVHLPALSDRTSLAQISTGQRLVRVSD